MKKSSFKFQMFFLALGFIFAANPILSAEEETVSIQIEDSENLVGTRGMTDEERVALWEQKQAKRIQDKESNEAPVGGKISSKVVKERKNFSLYKPQTKKGKKESAYYNTYYSSVPYAHLYPDIFVGNTLQLSDFSVWEFKSADFIETAGWLNTDRVIVTPNYGFFSKWSYPYELVNVETGSKLRSKLSFVSIGDNYYTQRIAFIDYYSGYITLMNGSVWKLSAYDIDTLYNWYFGDKIIIGVDTSVFAGSYCNILINVATLNHVNAKVVY